MGALIRLAPAAPAGPDAARVAYSVGRSLTAADFARQSRYVEARLLGLAPATFGVLAGLGLSPARYDSPDGTTGLARLTIAPGSGVGSDGRVVHLSAPMTLAWTDLLAASGGSVADGVYLLLLRSVVFDGLDGPPPDPATGADPLLDLRQDSFVEAGLSAAIGPLPTSRSAGGLALALNTLVGGLTPTTLAAAIGAGAPLGLLLVQGNQPILLSQAAGRIANDPDPLDALLIAQVREAFAMALAEAGADPTSAAWQSAIRPRFRFLPAAAELPLKLLLAPATTAARCPFVPNGMAVYLQAIRASQAPHLLGQGRARPRLDLAANDATAVTLSLAVPDAAWSPDLLDMPRGDPVLAADLHLAYARARAAQVAVREAWIALYGGMTSVPAGAAPAIGFLLGADAAGQDLSFLLDGGGIAAGDLLAAADVADQPAALLKLIPPWITAIAGRSNPPAPLPPTPSDPAGRIAALGYRVLDAEPAPADPSQAGAVPVASDSVLAPLVPALPQHSAFADWSAAISAATADTVLLQPLIDAGLFDANASPAERQAAIAALQALPAAGDPANDDTQPGALLQLTLLQLFHALFVRVARGHEYRLGAHGRLIALQRQHLDVMSTYVSALAGGVPSDGSGLSFARIIPFFQLTPGTAPTTPTTSTPATAASGGNATTARMLLASRSTTTATLSETAVTRALSSGSAVKVAGIAGTASVAPKSSTVGSLLGNSVDIAREVAVETSALSQAPQFAYQSVQFGTAAHITQATTVLQTAVTGLSALRQQMSSGFIGLTSTITTPSGTAADETTAYGNIVQATRGLLGDITQVENKAILLEAAYLQLRDRIGSLETRIAQLTDALAAARDTLRARQAAAAQAAGDYAAAQQLVREEIARIAAATAAREAAFAAATGLFYLRELQTLTPRAAPPTLTLDADTPADLAPGCAIDHAGPPAVLQPFLDLLLEVPLGDWGGLGGRWVDLPDAVGLQRLGALRTARLGATTAASDFGQGAASGDLATLAGTTRASFAPLFRATLPAAASLADTQRGAFATLALPDIVILPVSPLRTLAEALRARMESATGCLFATVAALPASTRFALAARARDGMLSALQFAQWPLPQGLDDAAAATARRLGGLVTWMSRQLATGASAAGQTALANLVTAAVIAAAYGDPNEAVNGSVAPGAGVPRPGVPIRVTLNRPPPIGTVLTLFDAGSNAVGTLRVLDHDALGTTAEVVTSFATAAATSAWTVAAPGARAPWLPT
jgi:hypothetical protein